MAVGADHAVTGLDDTLFGKQRMFDAHGADIIEMADILLSGKQTALL
jgi:hypothetical protein